MRRKRGSIGLRNFSTRLTDGEKKPLSISRELKDTHFGPIGPGGVENKNRTGFKKKFAREGILNFIMLGPRLAGRTASFRSCVSPSPCWASKTGRQCRQMHFFALGRLFRRKTFAFPESVLPISNILFWDIVQRVLCKTREAY
ncbi:MAG: hypothetical protein AB7D37_15325 [Desulfovibrio sp.]